MAKLTVFAMLKQKKNIVIAGLTRNLMM